MEPTITKILFQIFLGLITSLGQVCILAICIYYILKAGSKSDGALLCTGSVIWLFCSVSQSVGTLYISIWGTTGFQLFTYIIQGCSMLGSLLFVLGFFILIRKVIQNKNTLHTTNHAN